VSVRQYLTRPADVETYVAVRKEMITHEPTFMLMVVDALVWPTITWRSRSSLSSRPAGERPAGGPGASREY
jgi:hypothetical protein